MLLLSEQLLKLIVNARHSLYLRLTLQLILYCRKEKEEYIRENEARLRREGKLPPKKVLLTKLFITWPVQLFVTRSVITDRFPVILKKNFHPSHLKHSSHLKVCFRDFFNVHVHIVELCIQISHTYHL